MKFEFSSSRVQKIQNTFTSLYNNRVIILRTTASMLHTANIYSPLNFRFLHEGVLYLRESAYTHILVYIQFYSYSAIPSFIDIAIRSNRLFREEFPKEWYYARVY